MVALYAQGLPPQDGATYTRPTGPPGLLTPTARQLQAPFFASCIEGVRDFEATNATPFSAPRIAYCLPIYGRWPLTIYVMSPSDRIALLKLPTLLLRDSPLLRRSHAS